MVVHLQSALPRNAATTSRGSTDPTDAATTLFHEPEDQDLIDALVVRDRGQQTPKAIDLLYQHVDYLLYKKRWTEIDKLLRALNREPLSAPFRIAVLTITASVRDELRDREPFKASTVRLLENMSVDPVDVLRGLI